VLPRAWGLCAPFVRPLDSVFQEALALSHIKYGLGVTRGISGFGIFHDQFLYHAAHPPLLQLIYAGLYALFGVGEWVSRSFCTLAAVGTALCLWGALIKAGVRRAAFPAAMFFALMPLAVEMGRTTNYEPGALFFISLFILGYTMRAGRDGIALMVLAVYIGGFFEWTTYLAIPAVAAASLVEGKGIKNLKFLALPTGAAVVALVLVFTWQKSVVGVIPVLGHAATRSDPRALFNGAAWVAALSHPLRGVGLGWLPVLFGLYRMRAVHGKAPQATGVIIAYAAVPALFLLLAPQLVLTHPIASLYITAPVAVLMGMAVEERGRKIVLALLALLLIYYSANDVLFLRQRSPFFYNLSRMVAHEVESDKNCKVFNSAAVGYLRYYYGIETFHAVGANEPPVRRFVKDDGICGFILDVSNPEVGYARDAVLHGADEKIKLTWKIKGVEVRLRGRRSGRLHLTNLLDRAELPPQSAQEWENPRAEIMEVGSQLKYGIFHHARPVASVIRFTGIDASGGGDFETVARLDPRVCNPPATDGVDFNVMVSSEGWSKSRGGEIVPAEGGCKPVSIKIGFEEAASRVNVELEVRPRGNAAFDRFFWEDPRIIRRGPDE